ncbi:MAG: hypothetical protein ACK4VI_02385 [Alphaproteobacteria bacterium]
MDIVVPLNSTAAYVGHEGQGDIREIPESVLSAYNGANLVQPAELSNDAIVSGQVAALNRAMDFVDWRYYSGDPEALQDIDPYEAHNAIVESGIIEALALTLQDANHGFVSYEYDLGDSEGRAAHDGTLARLEAMDAAYNALLQARDLPEYSHDLMNQLENTPLISLDEKVKIGEQVQPSGIESNDVIMPRPDALTP